MTSLRRAARIAAFSVLSVMTAMAQSDERPLHAGSLHSQSSSSDSLHAGRGTFEFLPLFSYDTDVGFGYGIKGFFLDFLESSESFDVTIFNSTKGERWYRLVFSLPDFELRQGKPYEASLDVIVDYDKYLNNSFFGVGASSSAADRETYTKEPLEIHVVVGRGFSASLVGQLGVKIKLVRNFNYDQAGNFAGTAPINQGRSRGLTVTASVRYDSRNSFLHPSEGNVFQLDLEKGWVRLAGDYNLYSCSLSFQTYHVVFFPKTILAFRVVGQTTGGVDLPLHSYVSLGGTKTLRGYPLDRFLDRAALLANIEIRTLILWRFGGVVFFDAGSLAPQAGRFSLHGGRWKWNSGLGLRLMMETFIVRADLGFSREGTGFSFNFGQLF